MRLQYFFLFLLVFSTIQLSAQQSGNLAGSAVEKAVFFDFGKHDIGPAASKALEELARQASVLGYYEITISAHTDSIGTPENNMALSKRRAEAVKKFLLEKGLSAANLSISFLGETSPIADNGTDEGRQQNRRATVELRQTTHMITLEGTVTDEMTGQPIAADVILRTKDDRDSVRTGPDGRFKKTFPDGTVVGLDAFAECYFMKTEMLKAEPGTAPVRMTLKPARAGEMIDIENLYFVGGRADLLENSKPELPKILRFMQLSPKMKIEIAGHVNFPNQPRVVEESFEYKLSVSRAKLVHDYLLQNGISKERITYKGYGNWEMRFPKAVSEGDQAQNRRVEIRVLEDGCR